jgi:integrase
MLQGISGCRGFRSSYFSTSALLSSTYYGSNPSTHPTLESTTYKEINQSQGNTGEWFPENGCMMAAVMALNLYRRHAQNGSCHGGHAADSQTYETDEKRPKWKHCHCWIYASGQLPGKLKFRKNTKRIHWSEAREVADAWERGETEAPKPEPPPGPERAMLWFAIGRWYLKAKGRTEKEGTLKKYRTFASQLYAFAESRSLLYADQLDANQLDDFYATWKDGKGSKGKKLERMKGFFNFCKVRKFIAEIPTEDLEPPAGYSIPNQKTPFTDEHVDRIYEAAHTWKDTPWHNAGESGVVTAYDVVSFVMLMIETGLAITDAANFDMERVNQKTQECRVRRTKNGNPVYTYITDELMGRLRKLTAERGPQPFITQSRDPEQAGDAWRERLNKVFFEAGPFPFKATPHIFRHTFVRIHLQNPELTIRDVADLCGNTEQMIRKHYKDWVPAYQERISAAIRNAAERSKKAKWRERVVRMPKKA